MLKVGVIGAQGRMGSTVCKAIQNAADMELVAQLDQGDDITAVLQNSGATHAVEFTVPSATENNVLKALSAGVHVVAGTTGWTEPAYNRVRQASQKHARSAIIAPNYAISAVLAMKFASLAAPYFDSAEVIEMHHPNKIDAPSGTALATAQAIAAARNTAGMKEMPDRTETDPLGARGAKVEGVTIHAIRLQGLNAHEEILLGNPGEQFVLRSDCFDRESFMPGVLLALRKVSDQQGLTIGLEHLLKI